MHYSVFIATAAAMAGVANAVDMTDYQPGPGVDENFTTFYTGLVNQADNASATTGFTDYFPADGVQQTLKLVAIGPEKILKMKQYFLPTSGEKFVHFPNVTTFGYENKTARVYTAHGRIERTFEKYNNCSVVYYKTNYTILKTEDGEMDWTPANHQVYYYYDWYVFPETSGPTDIPCPSTKSGTVRRDDDIDDDDDDERVDDDLPFEDATFPDDDDHDDHDADDDDKKIRRKISGRRQEKKRASGDATDHEEKTRRKIGGQEKKRGGLPFEDATFPDHKKETRKQEKTTRRKIKRQE